MKIPRKIFCAWWRIFNAFLSTCAIVFHITHGKNNTRKCDTEGFVPVASLHGVVGLPNCFVRYLIGRTGKRWSIAYINEKWIYASTFLACTIKECAILRKVLHVTLTCPFIYWCSRTANIKWNPQVWHSPLNSAEINCFPASTEIISEFHHPNSSMIPDMDWNISSLYITSSVVIFSIPWSFEILD